MRIAAPAAVVLVPNRMCAYGRDQIERDRANARRMFFRELPQMFGYWLLFYAMLGFGIPWRMELPREVMWRCARASLLFAAPVGGVLLVLGALLMRRYALRKAPFTDFGPAASLTLGWSFRLFGFVGVPPALWAIFRVILPAAGPSSEAFVHEWWMWLVLTGGIAGWFSGRSLGAVIGLLAIWTSSRTLLEQP